MIGAVLLTAVGLLLVWKLQRVLTWLAVAAFLAVVLTQPVAWAQRRLHLRRALAVVLVLGVVFGAVAGAIYLLVEPLVGRGARSSSTTSPSTSTTPRPAAGRSASWPPASASTTGSATTGPRWATAISQGSGPALDLARSAANAVVAVLTILVLTVLLLMEAPTMMQRGLAMLPPGRRDRVARVAADCSRTVSGYVAGNLLISVIAGLVAFVSLTVLGVPFAAPLAVWVALADLIPLVGATLGAIPSVIVAFLHSVPAGIIVLAVFILYQQFENHVLQVTIMSRTVQLNPLLVLVSVLVGVELFGFVGALLAIPAAGVIQVIVKDVYFHRHPPAAARRGRGHRRGGRGRDRRPTRPVADAIDAGGDGDPATSEGVGAAGAEGVDGPPAGGEPGPGREVRRVSGGMATVRAMPALEGMRILDLTQYEAGPSATQALAWLGADVVKVERPGVGDPGRGGPVIPGSGYFMNWNSNKRSLALDISSPEGYALLEQLIPSYDVFVENLGPGVIEKLNLGYEQVRAIHPSVIYASVKGFGLRAPTPAYKCFDGVAMAMSGAFSLTGMPDGPPLPPGPTLGDAGTGVQLALAICAAYVQRLQTGEGQRIELSMQEAMTYYLRTRIGIGSNFGTKAAPRAGTGTGRPDQPLRLRAVRAQRLRLRDGGDRGHVARARPGHGAARAGRGPALRPRRRPQRERRGPAQDHRGVVRASARSTRRSRPSPSAGVPCGAVLDTRELHDDPHLRSRGFVHEIDHPDGSKVSMLGWPARMSGSTVPIEAAPLLGAHSDEVLAADLQLSPEELAALRTSGVVG